MRVFSGLFIVLMCLSCWLGSAAQPGEQPYYLRLRVRSELPLSNVPMDPTIDFGALIEAAGLEGVLDPNSIIVMDAENGQTVPHALEGFATSDKGRVEWVIRDPSHKRYEIRFGTAARRPPLMPADYTPLIGVGDLLRYNAGEGRPLVPTRCLGGLVDITGDGKRDLIGIWSYSHRPGIPWHCMVMWPRLGSTEEFKFGDMIYIPSLPDKAYTAADVRDVNKDGLPDVVHAKVFHGNGQSTLSVYVNSGEKTIGGLAIFEHTGDLPTQPVEWHSVRCVDLDNDGALDVVMIDDGRYVASSSNYFLRNTNPQGWPLELADATAINLAGYKAAFFDVDEDGLLDVVSLVDNPEPRGLSDFHLGWQKNLGGATLSFGPVQDLPEINARVRRPRDILAVRDGERQGLLVVYDDKQKTAFFEHAVREAGAPYFEYFADAECESAVVSLSDQAGPSPTDWDGDGDWDLLVGGGYGWPRIVINEGSNQRPVLAEAKLIESEGEPIRIVRAEVLGAGGHRHNMGYPFPCYVDWDADGLPDLMIPNETNRILWYKNIGTRQEPEFGPQQQVICDGYPDSAQQRAESARLAAEPDSPHGCYPPQPDRPFPWRCGAGFADFNGDGLMDMVTTSGISPRRATLFVQYYDSEGHLRLKRDGPLKTSSGDSFSASCYACCDWDGDGDIDIVCTHSTPRVTDTIYLARNVGTNKDPIFEYEPLRLFGEMLYITRHGPKAGAGDLDGDGKPDVLASTEWSVYPFYTHAALTMEQRPQFTLSKVQKR